MSFTISTPSLIEGILLGFSLLIPIGMQNMFILRQGALGKHPFAAAFVSAVCDTILIVVGALGVGTAIATRPRIRRLTVIAGVLFIGWFGTKSWMRVFQRRALLHDDDAPETGNLKTVVIASIAFSFLNPHAILDTTILLGSVAGQITEPSLRMSFTAGACIASWIWFFGLALFARLIRPFFHKPISGQILDTVVGVVMYWVVWMLIRAEWFGAAH